MNLSSMKNYKRLIASVGLATLMTVAVAAPAFAASDEFDLSVTGAANVVITIDPITSFTGVDYNRDASEDSTGSVSYSINDDRGTGAGWVVSLQASDLVSADSTGTATDIDSDQVTIASVGAVESAGAYDLAGITTSGVAEDAIGTSAVNVLTAAVESGMGVYEQSINLNVEVPAETKAGTYTGTLFVTSAAEA